MSSKRSELANILRLLADYVDNHPDEELGPILKNAATLMQSIKPKKKTRLKKKEGPLDLRAIEADLRALPSREAGDALLQNIPNKKSLEDLARFLQLPVQRDDTIERLRAKIVESTIGSQLRSVAIQGSDG